MNHEANFISTSTKNRTSKTVWLLDKFDFVRFSKFKSGYYSLFPDCVGCKYHLSLASRYVAGVYRLLLKPVFEGEGDDYGNVTSHLCCDHNIQEYSQIVYILGIDGLRKYEKSFKGLALYCALVSKSEFLDKSSSIFNKGSLELVFEMEYTIKVQHSGTMSNVAQPNDLVVIMRRLLESGHMSDFNIETNDETIKVHKVLLAATSPVFKAMFESDMRESRENLLKLDLVDAKVVKAFINYIYTHELELDTDEGFMMPVELFKLADYYQIDSLKILCENRLINKLSVESAVDVLNLSITYRADNLRRNAFKFIVINNKIFATRADLVERVCSNYFELMADLLKVLAD